jgi:hypothetical protein
MGRLKGLLLLLMMMMMMMMMMTTTNHTQCMSSSVAHLSRQCRQQGRMDGS